ncbi:hypothetical protein BH11BAC2_BH11BAC2_06280 [soil metagenome]
MGRQTGLIKLKGKIGGISFYSQNGADLARMANGPSKEKIKNSPAFRRTRENMAEFGASAKVGKALRLAIGEAKISKADAGRVGLLVKIFKEICLNGTGARGQRSIELVSNPEPLLNFEFTRASFSSVFNAPYSIQTTAARDEATLTVASFLPSSFVNAPQGATHFKVFTVLCTLSNYVYDPITKHYTASDPTLDMLSIEEDSAVTALSTVTPVTLSLNPVLPGTPTMTATTAVVLLVGCEFFQRIASVDYSLEQGDCMRVIKVF